MTAVAEQHRKPESWWQRHHRPLLWGLGALVSTFSTAALGLASAGADLTVWHYLWTAVASLVAGVVAGVKARLTDLQAARARALIADLRAQVIGLVAELRQREEDDEAERGTTAVTLGQLGATLAQVVTGAFVGNHSETREAAGRFAHVVIEALYEVLGGEGGRERGPLRVLFLEHRGGAERGLAEPVPKPGGPPVVLTAKWAVGHRSTVSWDIRDTETDTDTARRLMGKQPPWGRGGLVIDDVDKEEYAGGYCVLLPPDEGVLSYCRVAVTDEQRDHGILCIDSWRRGALVAADQAVTESFAVLLAAGLTVAAVLGSEPIRLPDGDEDDAVTGRFGRG